MKKKFHLSKVYQLLEPGPVVLVTTSRDNEPNVMTLSWHLMMDFTPPLVGIVMGNSGYSFGILISTKECVINIPTVELAKKVVACGNSSGMDIDKFKKFDLTPSRASLVKAPLIKECYASLECRVVDSLLAEDYNFFILKVVKAWVDPSVKNPKTLHHCGYGKFRVAGKTIQLRSKAR
jgi:flavin reductase (DIM6/NTAB) family NADH-FMN oxidoreductase RutF